MQQNKEESIFTPFWSKILITFCCSSLWLLLGRALINQPKSYLGLPFSLILFILSILIFTSVTFVVMVWGFPYSKPVLLLSWFLRYGREIILSTTISGLIYLIMTKLSVFTIRGCVIYFNIIAFFIIARFAKPLSGDRIVFLLPFDDLKRKISTRAHSFLKWTLSFGIALLPVFITIAIIHWGYHSTLSNFRPFTWNDQTAYWTNIRSFSAHGFNVGYSVMNETPAIATFNHTGTNSPIYVYFYGTVAKLVGWSPQLPIIINFVLLTVGILLFIRLAKLDFRQIILTALVILFLWPILILLPTAFQETLNQSIGIILAGIFFLLITRGKTINLFAKILFLVFLYIASLIRISWALLFFPLIFYSIDSKFSLKMIITAGAGMILSFSSLAITSYLVPPLGFSVFNFFHSGSESGLMDVFNSVSNQISYLIRYAPPYSQVITFEVLVFLVWSIVQWVKLLRIRKSNLGSVFENQHAFNSYSLLSLLVTGFIFYLPSGFYRVFSAVFLISILMQIAWKNYKPIVPFLIFNLIFVGTFITFYEYGELNYQRDETSIVQSRKILGEYVAFDNQTENSWCNTVLIPINFYDYRTSLFPTGIGISNLFFEYPVSYPLKSKYFLFDTATYTILSGKINAEFLISLPVGDLYYNLNSGCAQ